MLLLDQQCSKFAPVSNHLLKLTLSTLQAGCYPKEAREHLYQADNTKQKVRKKKAYNTKARAIQ